MLTLLSAVWTFGAIGLDHLGSRPPPPGEYDAIVVAGCKVFADGTPSNSLARRTELAVALWRDGAAPRVVFTGGVGETGPSEASAAASYAERLGLPAAATLIEDASTSTWENAVFSSAVLERHLGRAAAELRVVVVTDRYHVVRARRVFARHFGAAAGAGTTAPNQARIPGSFREVPVLVWYALTGRL
jgi:uncharacterized SAM-binding protein YcdF (DUF218 family)